MIGQVIGDDRYEIRQQLGKKIGRQTLLAWDRHLQEQVVLKLLTFGQEFDWSDLKLFEREAETLRSLSHPCIPQYRDFFEFTQPNGQGFALVQSYVEGRSLESHLKAGRTFAESDVKELAQALLNILIYLHDRHPPLIHRDIKPSNILLGNRSGNSIGQVYLVDFGSVQTLLAKESGTITVVGTYGYMPPEQFGGRACPASDLYSLGATLIYLLTGQHPANLPQKQLRLQFASLVNLSPELTNWLTQLVEPDLDVRLFSAQKALHWLNEPPKIQSCAIAPSLKGRVELSATRDLLIIQFPKARTEKVNFKAPDRENFLTQGTTGFVGCLMMGLFFGWGASLYYLLVFACFIAVMRVIPKPLPKSSSFVDRYTLGIDAQCIALSVVLEHKLLTLLSNTRESITELEYQAATYDTDCVVRIWAGKQVYELGGDRSLSATELRWLANELSDWLRLPIRQTRLYDAPPSERLTDEAISVTHSQTQKPDQSNVILLKRPDWIDILIPFEDDSQDTYTRLFIDNQQIRMAVSTQADPPPSLRLAITELELYQGDPSAIRVWAGKRKYQLGGDGSLSAAELTWLARELSDWLKLPIAETFP
ncbi:serine/threonine protein kinase [Phormidesmis sp. 146-35]